MSELIGKTIGRYKIIEQIGQGGMALVYKAFDIQLERFVTFKIIRSERLKNDITKQRFKQEAFAMSKLSNPNIVKVLDSGEFDGIPFLIMQFIPGGTLKKFIADKNAPFSYQEAAKMLAPIARALEYAHQHHILHRDVKPSNILISAAGQPLLTDFGIAKLLEMDETLNLTGTGVGIGTPEYMSPEQVRNLNVDFRSDIYSLGVIFYEMITGRKPFKADTPLAVAIKHVNAPLPSPKLFNPDLPDEIETFLYKALSKNPENRYINMTEFANLLEELEKGRLPNIHFSEKEEVTIDHFILPQIESEKNRNKSSIVMISGGFLILIVVLLLLNLPSLSIFFQQPTINITQPSQVFTATDEHDNSLIQTKLSVTPTYTLSPQPSSTFFYTSTPNLNLHQPISKNNITDLSVQSHLMHEYKGRINHMALSPDGRYIAIAYVKSIIDLWDINEKTLLATIEGHDAGVQNVAFSPDSKFLVSGSDDYNIKIWGVPEGELIQTFKSYGRGVRTLIFSPDGNKLAAGYADNIIRLWSLSDYSVTFTLRHAGDVSSVNFSPDEKHIISTHQDSSEIRFWDADSGVYDKMYEGNPATILCTIFLQDKNILVSGDAAGNVTLWDTLTDKSLSRYTAHNSSIRKLTYSPGSEILASGAEDGSIKFWDIEGNLLHSTQTHTAGIIGLGFLPEDEIFVSGSWDGDIIFWEIQ